MSQLRYRLSFPGGSVVVDMPNDELLVANFPDGTGPFAKQEDWVVDMQTMSEILNTWERAIADGLLAEPGGYQLSEGTEGNEYAIATADTGTPNLIIVTLVASDVVFADEYAGAYAYHLDQLPFTVTVEDETGQLYDEHGALEYPITTDND